MSDCNNFSGSIPPQLNDVAKIQRYQAKKTKLRAVEIKVDSGAGVSVASKGSFGEYQVFPTYESRRGIMYTSACGGKIADEGIRFPFVKTKDGKTRALSMRIAEVKGPLFSVFDMVHKNQKVVFDLRGDGSYVESHETGERVIIDWKGHEPMITCYVLEPDEDDRFAPQLCDLDGVPAASSSSSASGSLPSQDVFLRQADLL